MDANTKAQQASDFRFHFRDDHFIEEPRSNRVSKKRRCEDGKEEMQDAKGEALNLVSEKAQRMRKQKEKWATYVIKLLDFGSCQTCCSLLICFNQHSSF